MKTPCSPGLMVLAVPTGTNAAPLGVPEASEEGADAPRVQFVEFAVPEMVARWIVNVVTVLAVGVVNLKRASSAIDPPSALRTTAVRLLGARAPALLQISNSEMPPGA